MRAHKIRKDSATNRVVAGCCNSPLFMNFDDGKHWVDVCRSRGLDSTPPVQMRICTKFRPDGGPLPTDVPNCARYPLSRLMKRVIAKAAMVFNR